MPGMMNFGTGNPAAKAADDALQRQQQAQIQAQPQVRSANPYAPPSNVNAGKTFGVDPSKLKTLNLTAPNFDAQRSAALADISAQSDAGLAGAQTSLAQSGGLSAADRMALASQFNRNKIMGRQGALAKYGALEEQGQFAADKANQLANADILNRNLYETAAAGERGLQRELGEDLLRRQLEAAGVLSEEQMKAAKAGERSMIEKILDPGAIFT